MKKTKRAFTLLESMIVVVIIGMLATVMISTTKPKNIQQDALIKAGANMQYQLDFAFKQMLAKKTRNYTFVNLIDETGEFSVASADSSERFMKLYKKYLTSQRNSTIPASYSALSLKDATGADVGSLTVASFLNGFKTKNGAYVALKLNGNCTTSETTVYSPVTREIRTAQNSCGLFFYDVNAQDKPNILGVDMYLVPLGKYGLK